MYLVYAIREIELVGYIVNSVDNFVRAAIFKVKYLARSRSSNIARI
jgi:hypothetical protein